MILKERNAAEHPEKDKMNRAGAKAEAQMAFYLRRAFADSKDVFVFNDLRLVDEESEVAQFDHLVLHRRGFIIIESKSVTTSVRINKYGEWSRKWNGRWQGMPSPIKQAERQIELLKRVLRENAAKLRGKVLFGKLQAGFGASPFEILIAISDSGNIECKGPRPEEVMKAESIVGSIKSAMKRHRNADWGLNLSFKDGTDKYNDAELRAITNFLYRGHVPLRIATNETLPDATKEKINSYGDTPETKSNQTQCPKCNATNIHVLYGRFGYYYKCLDCEETFNIDRICPDCGNKTKTRKSKEKFYRDCAECNSRILFHVNV